MVGTARELELKVEPEAVCNCSNVIKLEQMRSCFSWTSKEKWFLDMESASGDAMKTVGMTTEDLEYDINLVDEAVVGCEKIDSNSDGSSPVGLMQLNSIACYNETS